ncbi:MAG: EAL domain-containing protein [Bryobacter sp.]|nr:EAL domain-containing protein [Bryobacter sp.]
MLLANDFHAGEDFDDEVQGQQQGQQTVAGEKSGHDVLISPVLVQGEGQPPQLIDAKFLAKLERAGIQIFRSQSWSESLSILGECEKLGTPVGLVLVEAKDTAAAVDCLVRLRQWRDLAELPAVAWLPKATEAETMALLRAGASDVWDGYALGGVDRMEPYALRAEQYVRQTGRVWQLRQERHNVQRLLEEQRSAMFVKDLWRLDLGSRTIEFNEHCGELAGHCPGQFDNSLDAWLELVHPLDLERLSRALSSTDWQASPEELSFEFRLQQPQGGWRWILLRAQLEKDEQGAPVGLIGNHTDITAAKTTDSITGLPNRFFFEDWLLQLGKLSEQNLGVFLFGLDRFHLFRDSLGAPVADQLVRLLGDRLRSLVGTHPCFQGLPYTIARTSSDEFVVAVAGAMAEDPVEIAEFIESQLSKGVWLDGKDIFTSFSCGHAYRGANPLAPADPKEVWRDAQIALHSARSAGGARSVAFCSNLRDRALEAMRLENDLNRAIENWEFEVFYQPKVTLKQNRVVGFEALLRWRHPEKGIIPPSQFISIAEANGLIVPLGIRTVREACQTLSRWQKEYPQDPPLDISVNLSVRQFRDTHLISEVKNIIEETQILPSTLKFEVTETVLIDDPEGALEIVEMLRAMGVGIKIDDFGTGYSSLSYLHRLPFESLKIDRSFITSMTQDHTAFEIVKAILSLAENLGLNVVAEGIEQRSQAEELRNMGCQYGQGYLFAPPLTSDSAARMLVRQQQELRST